jgi:ADP-heptose:LPS heptosyltransferase
MKKKILIIRWSGMGDIVMTLPALQWIRDRFPDASISWLTDTSFAAIPRLSGLADETLSVERRGFKNPRRVIQAAGGVLKTAARLVCSDFDAAFDLQGFGETAILARLSGAPLRAGRIKGSSLRRRMCTLPITGDWEKEHRTAFFVRAVSEAFGEPFPEGPHFPSLPLPKGAFPETSRVVGLNIGASTESRRWSEDHFFELARILSQKGWGVKFFVGPGEIPLIPKVQDACAQNRWGFSFHDRLGPFIRDLCRNRMLISNDTGPGHLAAAFGMPVVTLFSTGTPGNVAPMAHRSAWFREKDDINRIRPGDVAGAAMDILGPAPVQIIPGSP